MSDFIDGLLATDEAERSRKDAAAAEAARKNEERRNSLRGWWAPFTEEIAQLTAEWNSKTPPQRHVRVSRPSTRSIPVANEAFELTFELDERAVYVTGRRGTVSDGRRQDYFTLQVATNGVVASRGGHDLVTPRLAAEALLTHVLPLTGGR